VSNANPGGSRVVIDVRDTMPELYLEKFGAGESNLFARLLMLEERLNALCPRGA